MCDLGDALDCYTFAGVSGVIVTVFWYLNNANELIVDHNALGAVLTDAFRFMYINVVDQFPQQ